MSEYEKAYMEVIEFADHDIVTVSEGGNITSNENEHGWIPR